MKFSMAELDRHYDEDDDVLSTAGYETFIARPGAYQYMQAWADYVPVDSDEALEKLRLLIHDFGFAEAAPVMRAIRRTGRTTKSLIELRRLAKLADQLEDGSVPPLLYEARIIASLIRWMAMPVLLHSYLG